MKTLTSLMNHYINVLEIPAKKVFDAVKDYIARTGNRIYNYEMKKYLKDKLDDKSKKGDGK